MRFLGTTPKKKTDKIDAGADETLEKFFNRSHWPDKVNARVISHHQPMDNPLRRDALERFLGAGRFYGETLCGVSVVRGPWRRFTGLGRVSLHGCPFCSEDSLHDNRFGYLGLVIPSGNAVGEYGTGLCGRTALLT